MRPSGQRRAKTEHWGGTESAPWRGTAVAKTNTMRARRAAPAWWWPRQDKRLVLGGTGGCGQAAGGRSGLDSGRHGGCALLEHSSDEDGMMGGGGEPHSWWGDGGYAVGLPGGGVRDLRLTAVNMGRSYLGWAPLAPTQLRVKLGSDRDRAATCKVRQLRVALAKQKSSSASYYCGTTGNEDHESTADSVFRSGVTRIDRFTNQVRSRWGHA